MKKNTRIISVAAAALLAVAPVVSSAVPTIGTNVVQAATSNITLGSNTGTGANSNSATSKPAPTDRPYFTYNGNPVNAEDSNNPTANVIPTEVTISAKEKVSDIAKKIKGLVRFHATNDSKGEELSFTDSELAQWLSNQGVKFADKKNTTIESVPNGSVNLKLTGTSGNQTAVVQVPIVFSGSTSSSTNDDSPIFNWSLNGSTQKSDLNGQVFQVAVGSTFNPTNFTNSNGEPIVISASQNSNNTTTYASIEATSNSVNTSEAGRYYNVTLTATGLTGKKATATYTVLITSSHQQTLYANGASSIPTYSIYGNNVLSNTTTFKDGDKVYVADQTRTINNVSYSQVSTKSKSDASSSQIWVKTSSLVKPAVTETKETHTVMVASRAYDKNGNYLGHDYGLYTSIDIVPTVVTINGKTYYKVAGKDEYVRVTNITGTKRRLTRNAYIYWSSYRRTPGTGKYYRGQTVTTYGASIRFKNGKKYYRIEGCRNNNKRYIKAVNFY